jgi:hypothetical protein
MVVQPTSPVPSFIPPRPQYPLHSWYVCLIPEFLSLTEFLGSAVAVERIFSGGRDTIGLHRASLKAETIQTLMFVKARLRLARKAIIDLVGDEDDSN